jgi:hypothetical protein
VKITYHAALFACEAIFVLFQIAGTSHLTSGGMLSPPTVPRPRSLESAKLNLDRVVSENGILTSQGVHHLRPFCSQNT